MSGRLPDDCFALPPGVHWTPVDTALARLRERLRPVAGMERVPLDRAVGRILAAPAMARRDNPPLTNSAVDGYAFAWAALGGMGQGDLALADGRAAAGHPFGETLPMGRALRILTGAALPKGADTVVLQEDCTLENGRVIFPAPRRCGANARPAGEDARANQEVLGTGHRLNPADIGRLAAVGLDHVDAYRRLRVGILSTGDELIQPGTAPHEGAIYDANRPMLKALMGAWGLDICDLGTLADRPEIIGAALDQGASQADVILCTGGASAGDEDHVSRLLRDAGTMETWRIAIKPGRPLALGIWNGVPVFGLPGNPVAAFVCALIFVRPALLALAGAGWQIPQGFLVPAAFGKNKKAGRREYLRARLDPTGAAEIFHSEGSGLIGGLSWAEGLVELADPAADIAPGTLVRYLPYGLFGLNP